MEGSKLLKNYPFLEYIWKKYNYDKAVDSDESSIISLCNNDGNFIVKLSNEQKNICRILLRNLKLLHSGNYGPYDFDKYCNNIYNWLYYEIKEHRISDNIINNMFDSSSHIIERKKKPDCSYSMFKKYLLEPEKLVILRIFKNNIDDIQEILINDINSYLCSCQDFIKECVHLYKYMHGNHCSIGDIAKQPQKSICEMVNSFKTHYEAFLSNENMKYKFPELSSNTPINVIDTCQSEEIGSDPAPTAKGKQSDRSITQNASHAVTAMVGIPPFLALIYKFTPVRKLLLSKNKKGTRAFNNLDKDIENEVFHDKYVDTNATQMKFNVSYSPVRN